MASPIKLTRRQFLRAASVLAIGTGTQPGLSMVSTSKIPIGVQLYCVRKELQQDFEGTIEEIARIGFDGVEFADYFGLSAEEIRRVLDKSGLKCCGTHIYLSDMTGDNLKETVEFNRILGNSYLIVRWLPDQLRASREAFDTTVSLFQEVADDLRAEGMRVGYHNHDYIFGKFGDKMLWNILADGTSKDVILQLDTGNGSQSGVDVVALLRRNRGRSATIHIKPYSASDPKAYVGEDDLDWETIVELCETSAGTEWYIVEYEVEGIPPLKALEDNYKRFKALLA